MKPSLLALIAVSLGLTGCVDLPKEVVPEGSVQAVTKFLRDAWTVPAYFAIRKQDHGRLIPFKDEDEFSVRLASSLRRYQEERVEVSLDGTKKLDEMPERLTAFAHAVSRTGGETLYCPTDTGTGFWQHLPFGLELLSRAWDAYRSYDTYSPARSFNLVVYGRMADGVPVRWTFTPRSQSLPAGQCKRYDPPLKSA